MLITSDAVITEKGHTGGSFAEYEEGAQAAGARLPSFGSASEKEFLRTKIGTNTRKKIPMISTSGTLGKYAYANGYGYGFYSNYEAVDTYYVYYVFDVPVQ